MVKYILKESELKAMLYDIINEELSRVDEGFNLGTTLKNTAKTVVKNAALGALAPGAVVGNALNKIDNILTGKESLTRDIKNFFGGNSSSAGGSNSISRPEGNNSVPSNDVGKNANGRPDLTSEYGVPETSVSNRLLRKRTIEAINFPVDGHAVNFGKHYYEKFQNDPDSAWEKKVSQAKYEIAQAPEAAKARTTKRCVRDLNKWLDARDKFYINYVK